MEKSSILLESFYRQIVHRRICLGRRGLVKRVHCDARNVFMNGIQTKSVPRRMSPSGHAGGQAFFKWLAIVALVAAAGAGYSFFTGKQAHQAQVEQLRAENQQELAKQNEELERL